MQRATLAQGSGLYDAMETRAAEQGDQVEQRLGEERRLAGGCMSAREPLTSPPTPLLRGWLHAVGAVAAVITTFALLAGTAGDCPLFL